MPGKLDGLQFIREAWKADPGLLVVVATAYQDRSVDEIDRIFSRQFQDQWDYLNKPFTQVKSYRKPVSSFRRGIVANASESIWSGYRSSRRL